MKQEGNTFHPILKKSLFCILTSILLLLCLFAYKAFYKKTFPISFNTCGYVSYKDDMARYSLMGFEEKMIFWGWTFRDEWQVVVCLDCEYDFMHFNDGRRNGWIIGDKTYMHLPMNSIIVFDKYRRIIIQRQISLEEYRNLESHTSVIPSQLEKILLETE